MLAATDVACKVKEIEEEVVVFDPKKEVLILVIITWVFQGLTLCARGQSTLDLSSCPEQRTT